MTQRTTSPAFTSPPGVAFLTLAMMMSPRPATRRLYRDALPPRTLKHITSLAPVLSATASGVCTGIMGHHVSDRTPVKSSLPGRGSAPRAGSALGRAARRLAARAGLSGRAGFAAARGAPAGLLALAG